MGTRVFKPWKVVRRHPRAALVVFLVVAAGAGVWGYGLYQLRAAQTAILADRFEEASDRLRYCLSVWPWSRDPDVHILAARAARLSGDFPAAEAHLNRCLQLDPGDDERGRVQVEFFLIRVQTGEIDALAEALFRKVEEYEKIQPAHPESVAILSTLARTYLLRLRYRPGYACLNRWSEIQPNNPKVYQWRGWVLERLNNAKAATEDYHRALELDPDSIPVRLRIAEMLLEDKQAPEALPHLERLYRQAPNDHLVRARLGMCRFLQGRAREARELMESAVVHLPQEPALLVTLANLDLQEGRVADAEARLRAVLAADASDTEALFVLASVYEAQGRTREASETLEEFERKRKIVDRTNDLLKDVADSPNAQPGDYAQLGELFAELGRDRYTVYWLERALEKDPQNQRAHRALAAYYEKKGDPASAAAHRRQLRDPAP
jgi:tetratricopeptide (TPR) repeat protein